MPLFYTPKKHQKKAQRFLLIRGDHGLTLFIYAKWGRIQNYLY